MECPLRDNDVFCAVSVSGMMQSAMSVLLEKKTPLAATQAFGLRTHALPIFSSIQQLPVHVP